MQEIERGGRKYRTGTLTALQQFHLMRKLLPLFSGAGETFSNAPAPVPGERNEAFWASLKPIATAVAAMSMEDSEWCVKTCLSACTFHNGREWRALTTPTGIMMFDDLDLGTMLELAGAVIQENLGGFFGAPPPNGLDIAAPPSPSPSPP